MNTVDILIKDPKKPPKLIFSDRCVNCGKPKVRTWSIKLSTGAQKRGQMIQLELDVPLCAECVDRENKISNVTWLPFSIAGFLACALAYIPAWLLSPEGPTPDAAAFPFVFGLGVGLISGSLAGSLVEFGLRMLFVPVYGRLLLKRPMTIVSILRDSDDLVGLSMRFAENRKIARLTFENEEIAREFIALNPQEKL